MVIGNDALRLPVVQLHVSRCLLIPALPGALKLVVNYLLVMLPHVKIGGHVLML